VKATTVGIDLAKNLVGMEACCSAHYWARELQKLEPLQRVIRSSRKPHSSLYRTLRVTSWIGCNAGSPGSTNVQHDQSGNSAQAGRRVSVGIPSATSKAASISRSFSPVSSPTKSVSRDFSRLIRPSH